MLANRYRWNPWITVIDADDEAAVRRGMQVYNHADLGRCEAAIQAMAWFAEQACVSVIVTEPRLTAWAPHEGPQHEAPHTFFAAVMVP